MKIRYLLLGLMICVAGAGTINSSDGSFGGWNTTPFLIFGHVWYEDGSPCNNPIVEITNANMGAAWCADTVSRCNYYQALLCGSNVGVGDMLEFDVTDVAGLNSTSRVVNQSDLDNGGLFGFNLTLLSMMPRIVGFAPDSPVYDTENATRTFNITIDQVVDVAWMINGDVVQTNGSMTEASYTHTNVAIGVWNVSVRASNANGTDMQEWIWNVTTLLPPNITSFAPKLPVVRDTENMARRFDITIDQVVDVTWLINSSPVQTNESATDASYTHANVAIGVWNVSVRASNANGTDMQEWIWNVTTLPPPNITSFAPPSPVRDAENATRTFGITIDQVVDVTWLINGTEVSDGADVNESSYTNTSAAIGVWNISAIAENGNGTDMQTWIWYVNPPSPPPPSPMYVIYGEVFYENNTNVDAPCVIVTNLNTSREFVADNRSGSNFYQIITDASEIRAGDLLLINASKDGVLVGNGSVHHTVTLNESRSGAICVTINRGWADLRVVEIFTLPYIFDNATNIINATIANDGTTDSDGFNVSLAVDGGVVNRTCIGSLGAGETVDVTFNWTPAKTGDYTLNVTADSDGEIDESDETNNATSISLFVGVPDFTVLDVVPDSEALVIRNTVGITATVANLGVRNDTAVVEFYDNGTLNITRTFEKWEEVLWKANDTITIPSALAIRVHFSNIEAGSPIEIYDTNDSKIGTISQGDHWTDWVSGDTIRMEEVRDTSFTIDRYQALLATETISLTAGENKTVTASYRNATQGFHNLSVVIDPQDTVPEYNEANNSRAAPPIYVDGFDLMVSNVTVADDDLYVDATVDITATIENWGEVNASSFTVRFEDESAGGNITVLNETLVPSLGAESSINITIPWNLTGMDTSKEKKRHNITVSIPFDESSMSRRWPKYDNDMTNNIFRYLRCDILGKWDFSVEDVTVSPSEIREGDLVDITATIGNHGRMAGNVSVGFYIDMWDNILGVGGDLDTFTYYDCLGAARGWSRDNVSNATGYIRIGSGDLWMDVNTTNTTSIRWNADIAAGNHTIMVVTDPDERLDEYNVNDSIIADTDVEKEVFGNNNGTCLLNITPPDLSITSVSLPEYADVGDMLDITAVVMNNETTQAKSMLWWVVEYNEPIRANLKYPKTEYHWSATYPEGMMIRAHFKDLELCTGYASGCRAYSDVWVQVDDRTVYSKNSPQLHDDCYPCYTDSDFWTQWELGSTLEVEAKANRHPDTGATSSANFTIDKYQVVIDGMLITLNASEYECNTIWNATVLPGKYTVWTDVEDQNESSTIFVNGTDLAVTELSVPDEIWDGDNVSIDLTIANLGKMDAGNFTVLIKDLWKDCSSYSEPVIEKDFSGLTSGDSKRISVPWTACLKNGSRSSHNHNISVTVTPDYELPEINRDNNKNETDVHISKSRDFSVADLTFTVDNITRTPDPTTGRVSFTLGETVIMNATVDVVNHANCGGSVDVGFYFDVFNPDRLINGTTVPISYDIGNGTEYATLDWRIGNFGGVEVPGNHSITVVADPYNRTVEFNDSNNELDPQDIYIRSPDLVVEEITFDPESPEISDLVNITATVGNLGDKSESNVTVAYVISRKDEHIESPHDYPNDWNYTCTIHAPGAHKMRIHFGSIKIRGWLLQGVGYFYDHVHVYDMNGSEIHDYNECYGYERTTNWIDGDSVTVKLVSFSGSEDPGDYSRKCGTNWGFLIDRIDLRLEDRTSLDVGGHKNLSVIWNASRAGQYGVDVTIDPENEIPEHCESNNTRIEGIEVQGADLTVSNLTLTVNNCTVDQIIEHGDPVNITATIANIGVRDAHNINVSFSVGVTEIDRFNINLSSGESIRISTIWDTTPREYVGDNTIKVFADCDYAISETDELNNTLTEDVYVCTPELSGSISWQPAEPLDEDLVTIDATITNSGCVPAENFTVLMFYDYPGEVVYSKTSSTCSAPSVNASRSYDGAEWVYVRITDTDNSINQGDLMIYDGNNTEIARPDGPCWIAVPGDAAMVKGIGDYWGKCVRIRFYAVYQDNLLKVERLDVGSTTNITIVQKVTSFNHTVTVHIDPENNVPENNETDNTASEIMYVKPTRDFTVTNVTAARTTNLTDTDATEITAEVANIGFRNGTTDVSFVDYERENRVHTYWFDKSIEGEVQGRYRPPYAPVSPPDFDSGPQEVGVRSTVIHRPHVDVIEVDLEYSIGWNLPEGWGYICVYDETGDAVWEVREYHSIDERVIIYVGGDTAIIRTSGPVSYTLHGYTTIHEFNRTEVMLNATEDWNESKTVTSIWTARTGDHTITTVADRDDKIGEIDEGRGESNNNESIRIHVDPSRDPAIINITNTPLHPMDGDDVTIIAEVRNNGNRTANFTVDFWEDTKKRFTTSSPYITVPGASWIDVHFKYINTYSWVSYKCSRIDDIWLESLGDRFEAYTGRHQYQYVGGVLLCPGYDDWYKQVDEIRYKRLINRTNVTLPAGETGNVTAVWEGMSIADLPEYHVIVIVDPEDWIDEIDEGNNEMSREIAMNYPDFTVGRFDSATKSSGARVKIKNIGVGGADEVNVSFELARREDYSLRKSPGTYTIRHEKTDDGREADNIRVHFDYINIDEDDVGCLLIAKNKRRLHREGGVIAAYYEDVDDVWSPWVEGDKLVIASTAKSFEVDEYEWGDVEDETIDHLSSGGSDKLEMDMEEWEWEYTYTEPMNLTVRVDPDGEIPEIDEENNNETVIMYADLAAKGIEFASPRVDMLSLDAEKFVIDGYITNGGGDRDDIVYPVSDFNVTLEFRERYPNGTGGAAVFDMTKRVEDPIYGGDDKEYKIRFEFDPEEELEVGGNYSVYLIADSSGDICESNDLYPEDGDEYRLGEYNNITSENVYIYNTSGYTGGGELINVAQGEVNGRVVYTVGDEPSCQSSSRTPPGGEKTVTYTGVVPKGSGNIEFARLFVYWYTWEDEPVLAGMDATFNGHSLTMAGNYSDNPGATNYDVGYGLYSYDVTKYVTKGENKAIVRITSDWSVGIQAIGLLVVYEDEDEPFTKYWVNEGADIMMAENSAFPTGLPDGDCITTAAFDDVKREDTENVNASLLTVLGFYMAYGKPSDDALEFNGKSIGSRIHSDGMSGYWKYHYRKTAIALTNDRWEDVTDELERGDNLVKIRSIGNFMMPNNAFLRLIFPPDLNVINLTTPASTVVGAHHSINVTIRNDGRSDAHDFNATLEIDGRQMVRIPHLDLPAGENMTLHLYNWTPMMLVHVYNLTAAADVLSGEDWTEIETDNNAMTKHVPIEEGGFGNQTGPRGTGGGSNPTGGEYTEKITGKIMQGTKEFLSGGGGGGAGMFSALEWIMKGAVWLVLVLFVGLGYRMEQRSYGRASIGLRQPY